MGNVYFDQLRKGRSDVQSHEVEWNGYHFEEDYPFRYTVEKLPNDRLVPTRRWCERNLKFDIYFKARSSSNSGQITGYYWDIYFEDEQDRTEFIFWYEPKN